MIPWQLVPLEHQGWIFLIFLVVSFMLMVYAFYLIATGYTLPQPAEIPKKEKRR